MDIYTDTYEIEEKNEYDRTISGALRERHQQAEAFLNLLWRGQSMPGALVTWTRGNENGGVRLYKTTDLARVAYDACRDSRDKDVYFGVGLQRDDLKSGSRGTVETVVALPGLWMDLDYKVVDSADAPLILADALRLIMTHPAGPPSLIVDSGNGYHAYWLFKRPWLLNSESERYKAIDLSRRFQNHIQAAGRGKGWNWDYTGDLARVLRLPGTRNHKNKDNPKLVRLLETTGYRYEPDELAAVLPTPTEERVTKPKRQDVPLLPPNLLKADLQSILDECPFMAHFRDDAATLKEPEWIAGLTIVGRCVDAQKQAHQLSAPYPNYSVDEAEAKLKHAAIDMGPRTCGRIKEELTPELCEECPHQGIITSPIQLGQRHIGDKSNRFNMAWDAAKVRFPPKDFDWSVFPKPLSDSLKSAAISCNTSANVVPGIAIASVASIFGRRVVVWSTRSWSEPMIFWFADVRNSGEGKTPVQRLIISPISRMQKTEYDKYMEQKAGMTSTSKKKKSANLLSPRLYLIRNLTIEGLQKILSSHPTGGILCQFGELSAFIRGQDQYKTQKGTDRETWLELWDGDCIPGVRVNGAFYLKDPCVSVIGGIQRRTFKEVFGANNGFFFKDGTIHRFLFNYDTAKYKNYEIKEWPEADEKLWLSIIQSANELVKNGLDMSLELTPDALKTLELWRVELREWMHTLPDVIQAFLPKADSYALRLAAIIYLLWHLVKRKEPDIKLDTIDIKRGIAAVEFYLSNAVQAMSDLFASKVKKNIEKDDANPQDVFVETLIIAKDKLDNSMITIGELASIYNSVIVENGNPITARMMGEMVASYELSKTSTSKRVNGRQGICMVWDEKVDDVIHKYTQVSQ